jgi:pimeloyl-ACP methyl ester carboxylesterase
MLRRRWALVGLMAGIVLIAVGAIVQSQLPAIGAGGLLHPFRRSAVGRPPESCDASLFDGVGVQLKGWRRRAAGDPPSLLRDFQLAEAEGRFTIEAGSPEAAARKIEAPVLIIHGSIDRDTPPDHSRRVFKALHGPRQLILVPDAGHNQSLSGAVWQDIDTWIDRALGAGAVSR